ncbi:MAG: HAD family hydrolase [Clostridiales bacterium]|nr:HAD family hydrolase [Clostridiales bacterium]
MKRTTEPAKMRISFDLDEVLFVLPETHKTEPALPFPLDRMFPERLRLGTPELINTLQGMGYEVWVYTSSFRTERYIRRLFRHYGVRFDGIVNGERHLKEVQRDRKTTLPQKMPHVYKIALHIDDETVICSLGRQYGFRTYHLDAQDDDWKEKIIARAEEIRKVCQGDGSSDTLHGGE